MKKLENKQRCCSVTKCRVSRTCTSAVDAVEARERGGGLDEAVLALGAGEQLVEGLRDLGLERLRGLGRHAAPPRPQQQGARGRELHAEAHAPELGGRERVRAEAARVEEVLRERAAPRVLRAREHVRGRLERRQGALARVGGCRVLCFCPEAKAGHRSSPFSVLVFLVVDFFCEKRVEMKTALVFSRLQKCKGMKKEEK